jgi:uncharacterized membrane protein YdjX (TVP38/TMEM64 family)
MRPSFKPARKLDWRALSSLAGGALTFAGVGLVFTVSARLLGVDAAGGLDSWLGEAASGPFALPTTVAIFAALAFLGVPQVVLIAAAILARGPWVGMGESWAGTMVSCVIGYALGQRFGGRWLRERGGARLTRFADLIARNGFLASLLIRLTPSAPFIFVNMAAGAAQVRLRDFLAGSAVGILPKIALIALAGRSLQRLADPHAVAGAHGAPEALALAVTVIAWLAIGLAGGAWLRREGDEAR